MSILEISKIWKKILYEVSLSLKNEPILSKFYEKNILQHDDLSSSLSYILASKLSVLNISEKKIQKIFYDIYLNNSSILKSSIKDLKAVLQRDPVIKNYLVPFLYFKGFHALQAYRLSNYLWNTKKTSLSIYLQSRMSSVFSVDIHPAASIGSGIMFDHANGIVIGEGVVIEDNVSIFHSVTLGATGKNVGKNRHPKIQKGVVIGAGAKVLGNIKVGVGSKIGAGSIVLKNIPAYVTAVGIPAKIINQLGKKKCFSYQDSLLSKSNYFKYGDGI